MIKKPRKRNIDKFTGEKLIPIQVWVPVKVYNTIKEESVKNRQTIKDFLRRELEMWQPIELPFE
jgi:hypothetical protein